MHKAGAIAIVTGVVIVCYLLLLVVVPWLSEITLSVNATMDATSNMSRYPGTSGFLLSTPLILFFVPGTIGIIVVVIILRQP